MGVLCFWCFGQSSPQRLLNESSSDHDHHRNHVSSATNYSIKPTSCLTMTMIKKEQQDDQAVVVKKVTAMAGSKERTLEEWLQASPAPQVLPKNNNNNNINGGYYHCLANFSNRVHPSFVGEYACDHGSIVNVGPARGSLSRERLLKVDHGEEMEDQGYCSSSSSSSSSLLHRLLVGFIV